MSIKSGPSRGAGAPQYTGMSQEAGPLNPCMPTLAFTYLKRWNYLTAVKKKQEMIEVIKAVDKEGR
jgi:hypothetical protein